MTFNHINKTQALKGNQPELNLWLVIDQGDKKKARWIKLTGLWKTKDGNGYAGQLQSHMTVPPGSRLVLMPPKTDGSDSTEN